MSIILDPTEPYLSIENFRGGMNIYGFQDQENRLNGTEGDDKIFGGHLDDTLFGLGGNDRIRGFGGDDVLAGGTGRDTLIGGRGADAFDFFAQDFAAEGGHPEIDFIRDFNPEEDVIRLNNINSDALVEYDPHTGLLSVDGTEIARLPKGLEIGEHNFEFRLCGTDEDDLVEGGAGRDVVISGTGRDTLIGGGGNDVFLFNVNDDLLADEIDVIEDFNVEEDTIRFEGISSDSDINYDNDTGILSVDGDDIAQLDPNLNIDDDNYEFL